ncbi:hypothetical protein SAMN04488030_2316 [Aliiroseovarius halocynthiae]|uniref:Uncharacterized protein n=1 Tax=Aliiroseovarius halocynthiae TaxID=985055 RepID=A0A545SZK1_9RHOB|nr:hypothetical protein [Aliiroseovarius halocynthiae]TQV70392.1 hypothetical protein FIL88_00360 [Aliiroseovarius halocynthiae]SMR81892.1 hypothetical protein SAMN04488030_2316 [Aliiroseovarius halocynthiae]
MKNDYQSLLKQNLLNLPLGIFIGVELVLAMILFTETYFSHEGHPISVLSLAMPITLLTAVVAVAGILANIEAQQGRDEEARRRKLMAAKAVFALHLAEFSEMCQRMAEEAMRVGRIHGERGGVGKKMTDVHSPSLQEIVRANFMEIIEFHDAANIAARVSYLLGHYQVLASRWETIRATAEGRSRTYSSHWSAAVSWMYLRLIAVSLMHYARNDEEPVGVSEESLQASLEWLGLTEDEMNVCKTYVRIYARKYTKELGANR